MFYSEFGKIDWFDTFSAILWMNYFKYKRYCTCNPCLTQYPAAWNITHFNQTLHWIRYLCTIYVYNNIYCLCCVDHRRGLSVGDSSGPGFCFIEPNKHPIQPTHISRSRQYPSSVIKNNQVQEKLDLYLTHLTHVRIN